MTSNNGASHAKIKLGLYSTCSRNTKVWWMVIIPHFSPYLCKDRSDFSRVFWFLFGAFRELEFKLFGASSLKAGFLQVLQLLKGMTIEKHFCTQGPRVTVQAPLIWKEEWGKWCKFDSRRSQCETRPCPHQKRERVAENEIFREKIVLSQLLTNIQQGIYNLLACEVVSWNGVLLSLYLQPQWCPLKKEKRDKEIPSWINSTWCECLLLSRLCVSLRVIFQRKREQKTERYLSGDVIRRKNIMWWGVQHKTSHQVAFARTDKVDVLQQKLSRSFSKSVVLLFLSVASFCKNKNDTRRP